MFQAHTVVYMQSGNLDSRQCGSLHLQLCYSESSVLGAFINGRTFINHLYMVYMSGIIKFTVIQIKNGCTIISVLYQFMT